MKIGVDRVPGSSDPEYRNPGSSAGVKENKNILRMEGKAIHEVGKDRIQGGSQVENKGSSQENFTESETGFWSKMMIDMAENSEDFSAILNRLDTPTKLNGVYREISKALDPSLDDKKWDAVDGLLKSLEKKRESQKSPELPNVNEPVVLESSNIETVVTETDDTINEQPDDTLEELPVFAEEDEVSAETTLEQTVENNEPSLDQKVEAMKEIQKQKERVLSELKFALNGGEFRFNQGDPDWMEACSELLGETGVVSEEMARQIKESALDIKKVNAKELRGEQRNDAIDRLQKRIKNVQESISGKKSQAKALEAKVSFHLLAEQDAFQDFDALIKGKDASSRNSGSEVYWKNMQKFLSKDTRLSGARSVVDQILQKQIYKNQDERGVNKDLGQKKLELQAAIRNAQISERAA